MDGHRFWPRFWRWWKSWVARRGTQSLVLGVAGAVVGFVVVLGTQLSAPAPEIRLPAQDRLAALIQRQQNNNDQQRSQVALLRSQIASARQASSNQQAGLDQQSQQLATASLGAGLQELQGNGFTVTLDDSSLSSSPTGNVNDLVIHSQDVQAVVNAMWGAGADAVSVNGQRLVSTSAVLCVGNTLLINGTVHAPAYQISSIGADRTTFTNDALVRQLRSDSTRFSLRFTIGKEVSVQIPAYQGPVTPHYAQPDHAQPAKP